MTEKTPLYGIEYLTGTDPLSKLKTVSQAQARTVEAALANGGRPPLGSDLTNLLTRLGKVEQQITQSDTGWVACSPYSSEWKCAPAAGYRGLSVRRIGSRVRIEGWLENANQNINGSGSSPWYGAQMPSGFAPSFAVPLLNTLGGGEIYAAADGRIGIKAAFSQRYVVLAGEWILS